MLDAIHWDTYWLYVATEAALSLSPGPAVLLVVAYGMTLGTRRSIYAALGILSANALYFALSATALGALLLASPGFFRAAQWLGAAYLVWIGVRALLGHPTPLRIANDGTRASRPAGIWLTGLTLQLANPKTLIFFAAILPQFVDPARPVGAQMLWLAAGSIAPEFFILAGYGWLGARAAGLMSNQRYVLWTERAAGVLVLAVAALVLSVSRA